MKLVEFDNSSPETELPSLPRPLVLPAVGLAAGIAIDNSVSPGAAVIWGSAALACFAAVMAWRRPGVWPAAIVVVFVALGAAQEYDLAMNRWASDHVVLCRRAADPGDDSRRDCRCAGDVFSLRRGGGAALRDAAADAICAGGARVD